MTTRLLRGAIVLMCALIAGAALGAAARADDSGRIRWKLLDMAQLKLDGKPPLKWSVYQPDKKKQSNLILVLLGHRYLAIDTKARTVYVVPLAKLQGQGKDLETDDVTEPSRKIPSSEWRMRDVGPAESIKMTLGDYGRVLEVQLPHMPDMRAFY
ncbi:MAG TPA: hypothetical protein VJR26_02175 [Candidatus Acidoferrales bacterium]|nr:hypothetical protein [Candidatus Acidoferrales bacterium]